MKKKMKLGRKLSSKEIMVGDWVVYGIKWNEFITEYSLKNDFGIKDGDYIYEKKLIKVTGYEINDLEFNEKNGLSKRNLYAIPITPEILEDNGFHHICLGCWGEFPGFPFALDKKGSDDKWTLKVLSRTNNDVETFSIYYVHELQHIFRLCGIEKEIEISEK